MAKDKFAQIAYLSVTESAANTLTFAALNIATEVEKKKAMIVHRIEYNISTTNLEKILAVGDRMTFGISLSDSITSIDLDKIEVFDRRVINFGAVLTSGNFAPNLMPIDIRFSDMPGGGLVIPVKRLFLFMQASSLATATGLTARIWYTLLDLTPADYLELVDAFQILT
jgi:hypothetical protein